MKPVSATFLCCGAQSGRIGTAVNRHPAREIAAAFMVNAAAAVLPQYKTV
jgi:hypothetical protein